MASSVNEACVHKRKLQYSAKCKKAFKAFFTLPPPKKKRGRPRKKKRTGGKNKQRAARKRTKQAIIDLTGRALLELGAQLDGTREKAKREKREKRKRTNWDTPENKALREKLANAWEEKSDPYKEGDTFYRFCQRNSINRNVLQRFIERRAKGQAPKKRGRRPGLSEDVMCHLCERE